MEKTASKLEIITNFFSDFSDAQLRQFALLEPLYKEWNEKINVISRKDIDALYEKHVLHSLAIAAVFNFSEGLAIADLGTGGGFPGIPLAIMFPNVEFLLIDSIGKKLNVVNEIATALQLKNISTRHSRMEAITDKKFDFVVSRAVAPLSDLWKWSKPLLKRERKMNDFKNGLICLKGGNLTQEINNSKLKPHIWNIKNIFNLEYFNEKYLLYTPV
jgi:16S rRNA (guanine527-N7)-methyltransferase